jgi:hypothetical protein
VELADLNIEISRLQVDDGIAVRIERHRIDQDGRVRLTDHRRVDGEGGNGAANQEAGHAA